MDLAKPMIYLRDQLNQDGTFLQEWKELSQEDKTDLRKMAVQEMTELMRK